jgi:hypothetical protein
MEALNLQKLLRSHLGHDAVIVRPRGGHFLIELQPQEDGDDALTVARLTAVNSTDYIAAFRNHSGRWEPLPGQGDLANMAKLVTDLLAPFLEPDNY